MIQARNDFDKTLVKHNLELDRLSPDTLQVNTGKLCNLTCLHCHVNAGPKRKEIITSETVDKILAWYESTDIGTLDLTGGTPEMIPDYRRLVTTVREFDQPRRVMTRFNATIVEEPGYEWVPEFLAENKVVIVASMPCYSPENVNEQRGEGVFDSSIRAFQKLNALGYGREPGLEIDFVYNPNGAFLPGDQAELQAEYKTAMKEHFDIDFGNLFCIANMPIARFASYLKREKLYADYLQTLKDAFNPTTIDNLMCRSTISVSWEGDVYDCDFNQMLGLNLEGQEAAMKLWDLDPETLASTPIRTGPHCYGCTAGAGSSCTGALT